MKKPSDLPPGVSTGMIPGNEPEALDPLEGAAKRDATLSCDPAEMPVSYSIKIEPLHNQKCVRVVFNFAEPERLKGLEAFHFTLNHWEAGVFARKLEIARKGMKP
jgi:hypothetical protein